MSRFAAGSMTGDQLIEEFGLQNGGDVGDGFNAGAGASDDNKTKSNKALGEGYLTDETYNKLKNDSNLKAAYASINGEAAAEKKFGNGGISINTMDALFDDLTKTPEEEEAAAPTPQPKEDVVLSDRAANAIAYTEAYEDVMLPRQGDYAIKNDQSVVSDFENDFKLNLARAKAPQPQQPQVLQNAEVESKQNQVINYANNYKKAVGDTLRPNNPFM
jgi:hypothetical protein